MQKIGFQESILKFHTLKIDPSPPENMYDHLLILAAAVGTIAGLDVLNLTLIKTHRWFWLHLLVNFIVAGCALPDLIWTLQWNPILSLGGAWIPRTLIPKGFTLILHIYHIIMFRDLQLIDWVHHIVMCSILILVFYTDPAIRITNTVMFFVNGLPGGLDYLMLLLVKRGSMHPLTEKYYNSLINAWLRAPGILFGIFCGYFNWRTGFIHCPSWVTMSVIIALFWNAQYFSHRVAVNYGWSRYKNEENRSEL